MRDVIIFCVEGKIRGQGRPRFTRGGRAYTSKEDREYRQLIRDTYKRKLGDFTFGDSPIRIEIDTYRNLPQGKIDAGIAYETDDHKPDLDNVVKMYLDALQTERDKGGAIKFRGAFDDDRQVVSLQAVKRCRSTYGGEYVTVTIGRVDRICMRKKDVNEDI